MRKLIPAVLSAIIVIFLILVTWNAVRSGSGNKIISKSGFDIAVAGHKGLIEEEYLFVSKNIDSIRYIFDESILDQNLIDLKSAYSQFKNDNFVWTQDELEPRDTVQLLVLRAILKPQIREKEIRFKVILNGKKTFTRTFKFRDNRNQSLGLYEAAE